MKQGAQAAEALVALPWLAQTSEGKANMLGMQLHEVLSRGKHRLNPAVLSSFRFMAPTISSCNASPSHHGLLLRRLIFVDRLGPMQWELCSTPRRGALRTLTELLTS